EHYVANGYGIVATVATPGSNPPPGVRVISLPGFSTGRCRSSLGRKTVADSATISRRSRSRSWRHKTQHKIALILRRVGPLKRIVASLHFAAKPHPRKSLREQNGHPARVLKHERVVILEDAAVRQMRL